jgi:hypothetical protein
MRPGRIVLRSELDPVASMKMGSAPCCTSVSSHRMKTRIPEYSTTLPVDVRETDLRTRYGVFCRAASSIRQRAYCHKPEGRKSVTDARRSRTDIIL